MCTCQQALNSEIAVYYGLGLAMNGINGQSTYVCLSWICADTYPLLNLMANA